MEIRILKAENGYVIESEKGVMVAKGYFGKQGLARKVRELLGMKQQTRTTYKKEEPVLPPSFDEGEGDL